MQVRRKCAAISRVRSMAIAWKTRTGCPAATVLLAEVNGIPFADRMASPTPIRAGSATKDATATGTSPSSTMDFAVTFFSPIFNISMSFSRSQTIKKHLFFSFLCKWYLTYINVCQSSLGYGRSASLVRVSASRDTTPLRTIFREVFFRSDFQNFYIMF